MSRRVFAAVDGGNSKTDVVLGTLDGQVLAAVRGPGSSPHMIGLPGTLALLDSLLRRAARHAGLPSGTVLERIEVYLAGADLPVEVDTLTKAVGGAGWAQRCRVDNDLFAVLRAGTSEPDAVAVVCGAGTNCVGRTADGRTARFPALGEVTGDWGGGQHLSRLVLWHAARGEDGRGPATALSEAVCGHFGLSTVEDIGIAMHLGELDRDRIAELSPLLFTVAAGGDEVARTVVARQAREVVTLATVAAGRLDLLHRRHAVVLAGGVLTARHPLLHDAVIDGLRTAAPGCRPVVLADPPVAGAALLALDAYGPPAAGLEAGLRAAVRAALPG